MIPGMPWLGTATIESMNRGSQARVENTTRKRLYQDLPDKPVYFSWRHLASANFTKSPRQLRKSNNLFPLLRKARTPTIRTIKCSPPWLFVAMRNNCGAFDEYIDGKKAKTRVPKAGVFSINCSREGWPVSKGASMPNPPVTRKRFIAAAWIQAFLVT